MGISSDACLAFGIELDEEYGSPLVPRDEDGYPVEDDDIDTTDLGEFLARRSGIVNPYSQVPDEVHEAPYESDAYDEWKAANPDWIKYRDWYWDEKERLEANCPIDVRIHCSYDYPMYIICLRGAYFYASRGNPTKLDAGNLASLVTEEKISEAQKFCAENGLPEFKDPSWLLFSLMG